MLKPGKLPIANSNKIGPSVVDLLLSLELCSKDQQDQSLDSNLQLSKAEFVLVFVQENG